MTVVLELKPELEAALQLKASAKAFTVNNYVEELIEMDIERGPSLDEILAPVRKQFDDSGMTEDELDDFMNGIRNEVYLEKQAKRKG